MAGLVGHTAPFNSQTQSWEEYCEVLGYFFEANDIDDADKMKAILLSSVGSQTYSLMRNLVSPEKPGDKTFDQLVALLKEHYNPKPSEIVQRFMFYSRTRKPEETVLDFVAGLRKLAQDCNFGDKLKEQLRDRLVCGVADDRIQRRLLSEMDLTFDKALKIAQAIETANRDAKVLQSQLGELPQAVHKMAVQQSQHAVSVQRRACYRCGSEQHRANECRFAQETCHGCGKRGHIQKVCRSRSATAVAEKFKGGGARKTERQGRTQAAHHVTLEEEKEEENDEEVFFTMYNMEETELTKEEPFRETLTVNGGAKTFELDTGCGVTVMNSEEFADLWEEGKIPPLKPWPFKLKTYTGQPVETLGTVNVTAKYRNTVKTLPLVVVPGNGPSLLGRHWIRKLDIVWRPVNHIQEGKWSLQGVLSQYDRVFKEELGRLNEAPAKIYVDKEAAPRFFKPRTVPYAMRAKVEAEIERLVQQKIMQPVKYAEWAAPIVPVLKPDNSVRICGDYKLTVNRVSKLEKYPIPKVEDLFASLSGGQKFTKLDMSHAYHQIPLEEESKKKYVTINTHKGLFTYNVLPFGVSSSPAIFQRTMEGVLQGIPKVAVFLDDILLTGRNDQEHLQTLEEVLKRLDQAGLRLRRNKCMFMSREVIFLGHKVDSTGLHPVHDKVAAIQDAPAPTSVTELKAYLGLLNYYNLSTILAPVHKLLRKDTKWQWGKEQVDSFQHSKQLMQSAEVLVHYDPEKDLVLSCDASPHGVGAVLSHRMPNGTERPIGFVSRTLNSAERNYSQLDKEGLAVIFGVNRFHKYIFGRPFTIVTDHKPLLSLFDELKAVPQIVSPRIQRWAVTLMAYEYHIIYKAGKYHGNADALSRLPLPGNLGPSVPKERVLMLETSDITLVTAEQVRTWTTKDPVLSRVREMVQRGWLPEQEGADFAPFTAQKNELSVENGCVMWGARVVVPKKGQADLLRQLHQSHPGISRMKSLARSYVWWPKMDQDVENTVKACSVCQEYRNVPAVAPLHPWEWPDRPWQRVHVDYAGPFMGRMFFILIDAHSKWMEVYPVNSSTSTVTIECLRKCFSTHGLPEILISDNATSFVSTEFKEFMIKNGISHVTSAPYHASTNGLAERAVQIFKRLMNMSAEGSLETRVSRAVFSYRVTPQTTTGLSPAEMLLGRKLRCTLDLIHPDMALRVMNKQEKQKNVHDRRAKERGFKVGDSVQVRNYSHGPKWVPGFIETVTGPVSYTVMLGDGRVVRRHVDQICSRQEASAKCTGDVLPAPLCAGEPAVLGSRALDDRVMESVGPDGVEEGTAAAAGQPGTAAEPAETEALGVSQSGPENTGVGLRRSQRRINLPGRLKDFVVS
ncbi:uncharacterized protein K02A2.6-like [Cololabis saira]|uniref:uncharacterized protein K02A2.6-like n=1 Tax=Cololabis saira TaxID=129043 RepID=UPI002AD23CC1|nr:uncharacterized protein K02A2.6-like [Cololabis saira]